MSKLSLRIHNLMRWTKLLAAWCIRHAAQMLFLLPIKRKRILFCEHGGLQYGCSPKYISEYLVQNRGAELEIVWGFSQPEKFAQIPGIKVVKFNSPAWFYYSATASVFVTNVRCPQPQPKRKGQLIIIAWHGGGAYKRVGAGSEYDKNKPEERIRREAARKTDLFLSSSRVFTEFSIWQDYGYRGEVLPCGMPRNDLLFDKEKRDAAARRVRSLLGITGLIAVYAPTFRGSVWRGYETRTAFPYREALSALERRFGGPAVILKRAHPGGKMADGPQDGVLDVTEYPYMQELLCAADVLITDYSSCMWDFALLGRPCLLYMPDLEEYAAQRGLYTPPEEWPGIVCRSDKELLAAIDALDPCACAEKAARHLKALGSYETGTATQQVCQRILRHIEQNI